MEPIATAEHFISGTRRPGRLWVVLRVAGQRQELSGGFRYTANNRMELMACIVGLQSLKQRSSVVLYSDSQYVVNGISLGWAKRWRENNWKRNKKDAAENPDLWAKLLDLCEFHKVEFRWVRGHAGNPDNERCDVLSMSAAQRTGLSVDYVYEQQQ